MMSRFLKAGLLWPAVLALAGLAVLLSLGVWQWERKAWKEALIEQIASRSTGAPVSIDAVIAEQQRSGDIEYRRVSVAGRFRHDLERYFFAAAPGQPGWHVVTPLVLADGRIVWVNRGFVPDTLKEPQRRAVGQVPGVVTVVGLVRTTVPPDTFTPANDPARNMWYRRDVAALDRSAGVESLPFLIEADATPVPGGWPKGGITRVFLSNRHLEYALTWWGLAATLVGVFSAFAYGRLKRAR